MKLIIQLKEELTMYDTPTIEESRQFLKQQTVYEIYMTVVNDDGTVKLGDKIDETYFPKQACLLIDNYYKQHGWLCTMIINEYQ